MRKSALTIVIITVVAGVFGAFLRWLQLLNAFEADTGLPITGAATSTVLAVYIAVAAGVFLAITLLVRSRCSGASAAFDAFRSSSAVPGAICKICGICMIAVCGALMFKSGSQRYPVLERLFAASGILAGAVTAFGLDPKSKSRSVRLTSLLPAVFCCMWVILCYKNNAEDPVVWSYAVELLAIAAVTVGAYEAAACFYGRMSRSKALFFTQAAAFLCITGFTDGRGALMQVLFVIAAVLMLLFEYLLISSQSLKSDEDEPRGE